MSATGLDVFDKTVQTTNIWLDKVMADIGPDRRVAWHALGAVLHTVRDSIPAELGAHLASQLPLMVRGAFYEGYRPGPRARRRRDQEEFLQSVGRELSDTRPVNVRDATSSVFTVLSEHLPRGQCEKIRDSLPEEVRSLWRLEQADGQPQERAARGRHAQSAHDARAWKARHGGDDDKP
jgi:uncharacterized protein (DUF2267 family)